MITGVFKCRRNISMPVKIIHCAACQLYLGEIQKATLRKNIAILCESCEFERYNKPNKSPTPHDSGKNSDVFMDLFGDIFGGTK
jgi:hypothetical protein